MFGGFSLSLDGNVCLITMGKDQELDVHILKNIPNLFSHTSNIVGDTMYVFGGSANENEYSNEIYSIDLVKPSKAVLIQPKNDTKPEPRAYHRSVTLGKKIYYFGGQNTQYTGTNAVALWYNDVYCFDTENSLWDKLELKGDVPPPSGAGSLDIWNGDIYFFGGGYWKRYEECPKDIIYYNDLYKLDINTLSWTKILTKGTAPSPRGGHSSLVVGNSLLITGGYITEGESWPTYSDCFIYHFETQTWEKIGDLPCPLGNHTMWYDEKIHTVGGIDYNMTMIESTFSIHYKEEHKLMFN
eukprot:TRINITY_DN4767_c0_g2_i2.p1 TRINITY_DN4767_c0_g2~~TRINITY_DN4767_c0_g2_i2.p1  ORF type:complete len:298 (+),score=61.80 TRINITY_DN4767_c0_g2_i2:473-1366(+)